MCDVVGQHLDESRVGVFVFRLVCCSSSSLESRTWTHRRGFYCLDDACCLSFGRNRSDSDCLGTGQSRRGTCGAFDRQRVVILRPLLGVQVVGVIDKLLVTNSFVVKLCLDLEDQRVWPS